MCLSQCNLPPLFTLNCSTVVSQDEVNIRQDNSLKEDINIVVSVTEVPRGSPSASTFPAMVNSVTSVQAAVADIVTSSNLANGGAISEDGPSSERGVHINWQSDNKTNSGLVTLVCDDNNTLVV